MPNARGTKTDSLPGPSHARSTKLKLDKMARYPPSLNGINKNLP